MFNKRLVGKRQAQSHYIEVAQENICVENWAVSFSFSLFGRINIHKIKNINIKHIHI